MKKNCVLFLTMVIFLCCAAPMGIFAEPEQSLVNVALNKPAEYGSLGTVADWNLPAGNLTDGNEQTTCYAQGGDGSEYSYVLIDLQNVYDVRVIELLARTASWEAKDLGSVDIVGSRDSADVSSMEVLGTTPAESAGGVAAGQTFRVELDSPKPIRYLAIRSRRTTWNGIAAAELRAYAGLISHNPADGESGVTIDGTRRNLSITFAVPMKVETLIPDNIIIQPEMGEPVDYTGRFAATETSFSVDLAVLQSNTTYTVTLSDSIEAADGSMTMPAGGYSFTFTTGRIETDEAGNPIVNVALNKPAEYGSLGTVADWNLPAGNLTDGNEQTTCYAQGGDGSEYSYVLIDLQNVYDVRVIELLARTASWEAKDLGSVDIVGSRDSADVSSMEVLGTTPAESAGGVAAGQTFRVELDSPKPIRYLAIRSRRTTWNGIAAAELRAYAGTDCDFGRWKVTDEEGTEITNISGSAANYQIHLPAVNYSTAAQTYQLLVGAYREDGRMSVFKMETVTVSDANVITTSLTVPDGTVRISAALIPSLQDARMVVDALNLYVADTP